MSYRDEIIKAMELLAQDERIIVLGQGVAYPCAVGLIETLECFEPSRRIEFPVAEELQLGACLGLSLSGFLPLAIYPRMDFLILALNQLVNHLDKFEAMSHGDFKPKVIIRTAIGAKNPLDAGPQHTQDHTEALRHLLTNIDVIKLEKAEKIVPAYKQAYNSERSTILIEISEKVRA